jgi:hypothetical protein
MRKPVNHGWLAWLAHLQLPERSDNRADERTNDREDNHEVGE